MPLPLIAIGLGALIPMITKALTSQDEADVARLRAAHDQMVTEAMRSGMDRAAAQQQADAAFHEAIDQAEEDVASQGIGDYATAGLVGGTVGAVAGPLAGKALGAAAKWGGQRMANYAASRTGAMSELPPRSSLVGRTSELPPRSSLVGRTSDVPQNLPSPTGWASSLPADAPAMQVQMAQSMAGNAIRNASMGDASSMMGQLTPKEIAFRMRLNQRFMDQKGRLLPPSDAPGWPGRVASWADINGT